MTVGGLSTTWSYDQCIDNVLPANTDTVVVDSKKFMITQSLTFIARGDVFRYEWTDGGLFRYNSVASVNPNYEYFYNWMNKNSPATKEQAIAFFTKECGADAICGPLKENSPFQCTGTSPKSVFVIIALATSNAQLVFGLFGSVIVFVLHRQYETEKEKRELDELDKPGKVHP